MWKNPKKSKRKQRLGRLASGMVEEESDDSGSDSGSDRRPGRMGSFTGILLMLMLPPTISASKYK